MLVAASGAGAVVVGLLLGSRILAVADVVEAMASHRPYRASRGIEAALAEIEQPPGTKLGAGAVDARAPPLREPVRAPGPLMS